MEYPEISIVIGSWGSYNSCNERALGSEWLNLADFPVPSKQLRFYAYLTKYRGELVKVTVAVKHYRRKLYCKAVAWHGVHSPKCFVKDLEYCYCGSMGFRVGWHDEGIQKERRWYERGVCWANDRYYDPWAIPVNPSFVEKFPEYKYSAYKCVAFLTDEFSPYTLGEMIAPFDKDQIYPLQGLVTQYAFKRY